MRATMILVAVVFVTMILYRKFMPIIFIAFNDFFLDYFIYRSVETMIVIVLMLVERRAVFRHVLVERRAVFRLLLTECRDVLGKPLVARVDALMSVSGCKMYEGRPPLEVIVLCSGVYFGHTFL